MLSEHRIIKIGTAPSNFRGSRRCRELDPEQPPLDGVAIADSPENGRRDHDPNNLELIIEVRVNPLIFRQADHRDGMKNVRARSVMNGEFFREKIPRLIRTAARGKQIFFSSEHTSQWPMLRLPMLKPNWVNPVSSAAELAQAPILRAVLN